MKASKDDPSISEVTDENYWRKIIDDQKSSKLNRAAYCRKHQINYDNFGYWLRKFENKIIKSFVPIKIKSEFIQPAEYNKVLCTLIAKNGSSLQIYDKEVLSVILGQII